MTEKVGYCDINAAITLHEFAYVNGNLQVPPFRITRPELKELLAYTIKNKEIPADQHYDDIRCWRGVELEIVTKG